MTGDYSTYQLDDFLEDESFRKWALGQTSPELDFWEEYRLDHPQQSGLMLEARQLILDLRSVQQTPENTELATEIWQNIRKDMKPKVVPFMPKILRIAASVAVLITCWLGYRMLISDGIAGKITEQVAEITDENTSGGVKQIRLADGSTVSLQPNSSLRYTEDFNETSRIVHLEGEAFFDIARNPEKPFIVFSNEVVTKVLGTSFTIRAYDDDADITVAVKTGRVSVQSKEEFDHTTDQPGPALSGLVLTPNQKAVYLKKGELLKKTLVEQPALIVSSSAKIYDFNFDNRPLSGVFETLSKAYGVEIIYDEEIFSQCSLTVGLEDESLFEKLRIICKTLNASYQVIDTKILITGKGCKF